MPELTTLTQQTQVGIEVTPGTSPGGGATKLFTGLTAMIDPEFGAKQYRASGHRFDTVNVPDEEYSKVKLDGPASYTEIVYPLSSALGAAIISTPAGGVNARKWAFSPALNGLLNGKTLLLQKGDANFARQVNYGQMADWSFDLSRKDNKFAAAGFAQQIQDNIALTATPTPLPLIPFEPRDWNVYLDTLSANIGTTQLLRCYAAKPSYAGGYGPSWPMNRTLPSFGTVVDLAPKVSLELDAMADGNIGALWALARQASKTYIRLGAVSQILADNYQTLTISGSPTGGTFTLTYKNQVTAPIAYNALGSAVATALTALSSIGAGGVSVTGGAGGPYVVTFLGALANDTTLLTHTDSFTPSGSLAVVQTTVAYSMNIDMCCVPIPGAYKDEAGAWTQAVRFAVVEDPTWTEASPNGTGIYLSVVNNLLSL